MEANDELSGHMRRGNLKGLVITAIAAMAAYILYLTLPYDNNANKGLAILLFVTILWFTEAVHITITALMVPVLAAVVGIPEMGIKEALAGFADPTIFIFFGGFALATALHIQKLDRKIVLWLISLSKGNILVAVLLMFGVTAFLSMWMSNITTAAMMLPLALGMMSHLDKGKDRKIFVFVLLGIAYCASIGGLSMVIAPPDAIVAKALGLVDFVGWMKHGLLMMLMMLMLLSMMLVSLYFVLRPKFSQSGAVLSGEAIPWTRSRIVTLILFVCTMLAWIFSSKLKIAFGLTDQDALIALTAAVLVVMFGLATWHEVAENTDWGVLLLLGGGISLSNLLKNSGTSIFTVAQPFIVILAAAAFILCIYAADSNSA